MLLFGIIRVLTVQSKPIRRADGWRVAATELMFLGEEDGIFQVCLPILIGLTFAEAKIFQSLICDFLLQWLKWLRHLLRRIIDSITLNPYGQ